MAITYPLTVPTTPGPSQQTWSLESAASTLESPYTYQTQVQEHAGQRWMVSNELPPMAPSTAGAWRAFIASLRGSRGTFTLGDYSRKTPEGNAQYVLQNEFKESAGFDQADWTVTRASVVADAATDPDGTSTADKLVEDATATNTHFIKPTVNTSTVSGTNYTFSVYAKAVERSWIGVMLGTAGFAGTPYGFFDVGTGALGTISAVDSASITSVGGGWYRCSVTKVADATTSANTPFIALCDGDSGQVYSGDGSSGLYLWGAQWRLDSSSSVYVKTTTGFSSLMAPLVNGASQTSDELITDGWATHQTQILAAGDWLQLGSGASAQLYMVAADVTTDATGNATITLIPDLRSSPADDAAITYSSTVGLFRLANNSPTLFSTIGTDISKMSFTAIEAL